MANRGYNGTIVVGGLYEGRYLVQSGKTYAVHTTEDMFDALDFLFESTEENDEFLLWYNSNPKMEGDKENDR